jgi:hypothetical protein
MPMSNYLRNKILDHIYKNTPYTPPATVYVALYTSNPTDLNTGTEVSGGGYARQPITFGANADVTINTEKYKQTSNNANVSFPQATANWGIVTHFGIFDAASGGNLLDYDPLTTSRNILSGDNYAFLTNQLKVSKK